MKCSVVEENIYYQYSDLTCPFLVKNFCASFNDLGNLFIFNDLDMMISYAFMRIHRSENFHGEKIAKFSR
jgi:hypothetical protein